uniref:Uncharacterized protein n=1 Tax=Arundo donax TaxID=35708 RepID=A0A0A8ZR32_ARUDO
MPIRTAAMASQASFAVALTTNDSIISSGTALTMASRAMRSSW